MNLSEEREITEHRISHEIPEKQPLLYMAHISEHRRFYNFFASVSDIDMTSLDLLSNEENRETAESLIQAFKNVN